MARPPRTSIQELINAAASVFERKGFVDATMSDIAAEAGISKPTVYQYVDSKNWLLEKIVQQVIYPLRDGLEVIVASDASALEKLEQYVRLQVNSAIRYRTYYAVLIADQHQLSDQALREYLSWARDVNHTAQRLLRDCAQAGVVRDDIDIGTAVNLLNGMLTSIARWYQDSGPIGPDELVRQVMGLLSGYVLPQPQQAEAKLDQRSL